MHIFYVNHIAQDAERVFVLAGIVSCSLVHEKATDPTASGHVRANLELAGYLIEAESNLAESCKLTCLMKLDLGGSLMAWIKTKAVADQVKLPPSSFCRKTCPLSAAPPQQPLACSVAR